MWKPPESSKGPEAGFGLGVSKITTVCSILLLPGVQSTLSLSLSKVTITLSIEVLME